ncbi:unnamed protein product [Brassica napus]|uniref:(rape) hypothetical protein n=1 Tax=Brassica napus TaxID=3708 RepID=A0A816QZG3_BRANA|nr:unnamed protein product [Brassica napus]
MFELWFRRWRLPQIRRRPAFLRGWRLLQLRPAAVQVPGKGVFLRFAFAGLVTECGCFHRSVLPMKTQAFGSRLLLFV